MFFQTVRNACRTLLPLTNAVAATHTSLAPKMPITTTLMSRSYHLLSSSSSVANRLQTNVFASATGLLQAAAAVPQFTQTCGFKVKGVLRRRCKDCFFVQRQGRLYNICFTHPRHKQMAMQKKPKNTWILTHATQSKVRPW